MEHSLIPGCEFKGGLITKERGTNADENSRYTRHLRDSKDFKEDRTALAKELSVK